MSTTPAPDSEPLRAPLSDPLGLVVDAAGIECWKANYGLERTPHELNAYWRAGAPPGAVLALKAAVHELERLRALLGMEETKPWREGFGPNATAGEVLGGF